MSIKNTISIYGCGGAGINIVTKVLSIPSTSVGFPEVEYTLIDTSDSNLKGIEKSNNKYHTYLIPGVDGAGKDRKFGIDVIEPHCDKVLNLHKPKDCSIVIYSLAGGSGSTAGPLIVRELLKRDKCVISICIGNTTNGVEAKNTLDTIADLQRISKKLDKPLVACFYKNDNSTPRSAVDDSIENDVRALSLLLSGANEELDGEDIQNFLYFNKKKNSIPAQVVDMLIYSKSDDSEDPSGFTAIGVASVLPSRSHGGLDLGQTYGCVGYMPAGVTEASSSGIKPLHYILTNSLMNERLESYQATVKRYKDSKDELISSALLTLVEGDDGDDTIF